MKNAPSKFVKVAQWLLLLLAIVGVREQANAQTLQESALVANYLTGFAEFTRWDTPREQTLTIAVLDAPGLQRELRKLAADRTSTDRELRVIAWTPEQNLNEVDILYLSQNYKISWPSIIAKAKASSTLTVSSTPGFIEAGGLIQFTTSQNRLRFLINTKNTPEYRIRFSSKLVHIAMPIEREDQ